MAKPKTLTPTAGDCASAIRCLIAAMRRPGTDVSELLDMAETHMLSGDELLNTTQAVDPNQVESPL